MKIAYNFVVVIGLLISSLACCHSRAPRSGLPNSFWADESSDDQAWFTLSCSSSHERIASMHSFGDEWMIWVNIDDWRIGTVPYPSVVDAQWAAERYVDSHKLCATGRSAVAILN
jgi:hypothetical protein